MLLRLLLLLPLPVCLYVWCVCFYNELGEPAARCARIFDGAVVFGAHDSAYTSSERAMRACAKHYPYSIHTNSAMVRALASQSITLVAVCNRRSKHVRACRTSSVARRHNINILSRLIRTRRLHEMRACGRIANRPSRESLSLTLHMRVHAPHTGMAHSMMSNPKTRDTTHRGKSTSSGARACASHISLWLTGRRRTSSSSSSVLLL